MVYLRTGIGIVSFGGVAMEKFSYVVDNLTVFGRTEANLAESSGVERSRAEASQSEQK